MYNTAKRLQTPINASQRQQMFTSGAIRQHVVPEQVTRQAAAVHTL